MEALLVKFYETNVPEVVRGEMFYKYWDIPWKLMYNFLLYICWFVNGRDMTINIEKRYTNFVTWEVLVLVDTLT